MYKMVLPVSMWVPLGTSCGYQPLPFLEPLDDQVGPLVVTVENVEVVVGHVTPRVPAELPYILLDLLSRKDAEGGGEFVSEALQLKRRASSSFILILYAFKHFE